MIHSINIKQFRGLNQVNIKLGKVITVISGHNATGKSTILALLGHPAELKKKDGQTVFGTSFRTEFSEIIKGSKEFDSTGKFGTVHFSKYNTFDTISESRTLRVTWPTLNKKVIKDGKVIGKIVHRFRIVAGKMDIINTKIKNIDRKYEWPTLYLGLSRLFPYGETKDENNKASELVFKNEEEKLWYLGAYKSILNINDNINTVNFVNHKDISSKKTIGITTDTYSYITNSAGQDNIGQILLALISFKRLKEQFTVIGKSWEGGLLLIDEFDATLHPIAQIKLLKLLFEFGLENHLQIVFTTHSLYLLKTLYTLINTKETYRCNCEVVNMTKKNRQLEIIQNPDYSVLYSDLTLTNVFNSTTSETISVFTEDDETRWFLEKLIPNYAHRITYIKAKISCNELLRLRTADADFFTKVIIALDGDVDINSISSVNTIKNSQGREVKNVIKLPGDSIRPESIIYNYLLTLSHDHEYLRTNPTISIMQVEENGPFSDKYKYCKHDRNKFKDWFNDNVNYFETTNLISYWIRDNQPEVDEFNNLFKKTFNTVAHELSLSRIN